MMMIATNIDEATKLLQRFKHPDPEKTLGIRGLFVRDGWTYATNRVSVARVRTPDVSDDHGDCPPAWDLWYWKQFPLLKANPLLNAKPFPKPVHIETLDCRRCERFGKLYSCPECNGEGEVSYHSTFGNYTADLICPVCVGNGAITRSRFNEIKAPGIDPGHDCSECGGKGYQTKHDCVWIDDFLLSLSEMQKLWAAGAERYIYLPPLSASFPRRGEKNQDGRYVEAGTLLFEAEHIQGVVMCLNELNPDSIKNPLNLNKTQAVPA